MRVRQAVTIDRDAVSPDSISAAMEYLVGALAEMAVRAVDPVRGPGVLDWNTLHVYTRRTRRGEHRVIAWAKVLG